MNVQSENAYINSPEAWNIPLSQVTWSVLDTETTGISPRYGHRICQFALYKGQTGCKDPKRLYCHINPCRKVDPKAGQIHGLSDDFLSTMPPFPKIAHIIERELDNTVIVGHNVNFDLKFLAMEFRRAGRKSPRIVAIDTLVLAKAWLDLPNYKLTTIAEAMELDFGAHNAMEDTRATWLLWDAMVEKMGSQVETLDKLLLVQGGAILWPSEDWGKYSSTLRDALYDKNKITFMYVNKQGSSRRIWGCPVDAMDGVLQIEVGDKGDVLTLTVDSMSEIEEASGYNARTRGW